MLIALQRWVRSQPILYRLTLGTRILLAVGFVPTGMVKLLGYRFTRMSPETHEDRRSAGGRNTPIPGVPNWDRSPRLAKFEAI